MAFVQSSDLLRTLEKLQKLHLLCLSILFLPRENAAYTYYRLWIAHISILVSEVRKLISASRFLSSTLECEKESPTHLDKAFFTLGPGTWMEKNYIIIFANV